MAMRYLPKSQSDREEMLNDIGVKSVDALFAAIPEEYRLTGDLRIPRSYAESEIVEFFRDRAAENGQGFRTFLGAGAYSHYRPVVRDAQDILLIRRISQRLRKARCSPYSSFRP